MKKVISFLLVITMILCAGTFAATANTSSIGGEKINRVVYVDSLDVFVVCGSDGIYTSTVNSDWTKRSPYTEEALNFGYSEKQDVGIIVKSVSNTSDKTPVLINDLSEETSVYNITEIEGGTCKSVMFFSGGFCYDPYSECFWAVGREYSLEGGSPVFKRMGIYYTDGEITTAQYRGADTSIMKWARQTGDIYDQYEELYVGNPKNPSDSSKGSYEHQSSTSYAYQEMKSSGDGYIIAYYMTQSNTGNQYPIEGRRGFSIIEIEKGADGFTSNGYITTNGGGSPGNLCKTMEISDDGTLYSYSNASSTKNRFYTLSISDLVEEIKEKGVNMESSNYGLTAAWPQSTMSSYDGISVTTGNLAYSDFCAIDGKCIILSQSNTSTQHLVELSTGFQKASFCTDEMMNEILGTTYSAGTYSSIATDDKGNLCIAVKDTTAGKLKASIIDTQKEKSVTSLDANTEYTYISGNDNTISIAPGSAEAHGLLLDNQADKMGYTYIDSDGAKYACDLDGIDVNGIYAWEEAVSGAYTFELTAYSIDFPSIKRTVQITVNIEED